MKKSLKFVTKLRLLCDTRQIDMCYMANFLTHLHNLMFRNKCKSEVSYPGVRVPYFIYARGNSLCLNFTKNISSPISGRKYTVEYTMVYLKCTMVLYNVPWYKITYMHS